MLAFAALDASAQASIKPLRHTAREESTLVVTRFLLASTLGDRRTACAMFPSDLPCRRADEFVGPADFRLVGITLVDPKHPVVSAEVEGVGGSFVLARAGSSFVIARARGTLARVLRAAPVNPHRKPVVRSARAKAILVVTRFLLASALEDRRTACAMFPGYLFCQRGQRLLGAADFNVVDVDVSSPAQPVVFANVGGVRGYFVLKRARNSLVIVSAAAD